jgi:chemotaxis response regulator CheB
VVVVADDHPVFLDGLARIVSRAAELTLVATARDGRVALDRIRAERPDVALIDLELPDVDGFRVIETVRREALPTRVLVISPSSTARRSTGRGGRGGRLHAEGPGRAATSSSSPPCAAGRESSSLCCAGPT